MSSFSNVYTTANQNVSFGVASFFEASRSDPFAFLTSVKVASEWMHTAASLRVSQGLGKFLPVEGLINSIGAACDIPGKTSDVSEKTFEVFKEGAAVSREKMFELVYTIRQLASKICAFVSDWSEACRFFVMTKVIKSENKWFIPSQVCASSCGMFSCASKVYDYVAGYNRTVPLKTGNKKADEAREKLAQIKDKYNATMFASVFVIHAFSLATLSSGACVVPMAMLMATTSYAASRVLAHYVSTRIDEINGKDPRINQVKSNLSGENV